MMHRNERWWVEQWSSYFPAVAVPNVELKSTRIKNEHALLWKSSVYSLLSVFSAWTLTSGVSVLNPCPRVRWLRGPRRSDPLDHWYLNFTTSVDCSFVLCTAYWSTCHGRECSASSLLRCCAVAVCVSHQREEKYPSGNNRFEVKNTNVCFLWQTSWIYITV